MGQPRLSVRDEHAAGKTAARRAAGHADGPLHARQMGPAGQPPRRAVGRVHRDQHRLAAPCGGRRGLALSVCRTLAHGRSAPRRCVILRAGAAPQNRRPQSAPSGRSAAETDMSPSRKKLLAWSVHFYTALGLVAAGGIAVAIIEATPASFRLAFLLMLVATLIDATDGTLARWIRIKEVLPGFDGRRLD